MQFKAIPIGCGWTQITTGDTSPLILKLVLSHFTAVRRKWRFFFLSFARGIEDGVPTGKTCPDLTIMVTVFPAVTLPQSNMSATTRWHSIHSYVLRRTIWCDSGA